MPDKTPAQLLEGYAEFADARRQEWLVPGCAVAIVKDGNVVFSRGFGMRDVANNLPVTPDTVFAIGSCTKAFTCTALGMLADAGKLDWDKPVRDYVPEFRLYDSFATERMTARDLVTHRSGLPRHDLLWYGGKFSRQDMFSRLRYLEPSKDFRAVFQYNNLMYMAAGVLIERLAGCTWEEFIRQRFFGPLGMAHSNTSVTVSPTLDDFAKPYDKVKDKEEVKQIPFRNIDAIGPAGAINSSVSDMAHWLLLNLNKGKHGDQQRVSQAMLQQIYAPVMVMGGAPDDDPEIGQTTYGLGWAIYSYRGHHMIQHGGGIDGFLSQVTLLPRENIGIVALTNLTPSALCPVLTHNALDRLLGLDEVDWSKRYKEREAKAKEAQAQGEAHGAQKPESGRKLDTEPSHRLDDYVGEYEHPGYGRATVAWRDGQLSLASSGIEMPLKHFHYDVFEARYDHLDMTVKVTFGVDADGLVSTLSAPLEPAVKPVVFTRVPSEALTDRARLEQFVGEYELMGMLASISLLGDHALLATVPGQPAQELAPVEGDRFKLKAIEGISLEFKRNEQGAVVELVFQQPNGSFVAKRK